MTPRSLPRPAAFWLLAAVSATFLAASAAPSPLYVVFQAEWGFSPTTLTAVFAVYALALLAALLTAGALSDHVGRRPVIAGALLVEIAAMAVFAGAQDVGWLFAARIVQGLATGAATGALAAALIDLHPPRGALFNTLAPTAGLAAGALGSGLLVQFGPHPTSLVFVILASAFAVFLLALAAVPETTARRPGALASLRPSAAVPAHARPTFATLVPALTATWALGGLYLSLGPSLAARVLDVHNHVAGGLVVTALAGSASLASFAARGVEPRRAMITSTLALALGVAVSLVALETESIPLFYAGAAIAGAGFGPAFLSAIRLLAALAEPAERAALLSVVYVLSYLAFSIPAVIAGLVVTSAGLRPTAVVYGAVVIALATSAAAGFALQGRRALDLSPSH